MPRHHRLDHRQELGGSPAIYAQRLGRGQCGGHVPAQHHAGHRPDLPTKPLGQVPDLPALERARCVQDLRAVRAVPFAGRAIAFAPAVDPLGEGVEAFFSCSSSRPFAT